MRSEKSNNFEDLTNEPVENETEKNICGKNSENSNQNLNANSAETNLGSISPVSSHTSDHTDTPGSVQQTLKKNANPIEKVENLTQNNGVSVICIHKKQMGPTKNANY